MATRVMSAANNSATNNNSINNHHHDYPSYMPPLNNNTYSIQNHPYLLEQHNHTGAGGGLIAELQNDNEQSSMMHNNYQNNTNIGIVNMNDNNGITKQSLMDIYSRNQAILSQHHSKQYYDSMTIPEPFYHPSQHSATFQQHVNNNPFHHSQHPLNVDTTHMNQSMYNPSSSNQQNFFSPEHVDGMVSILKGEEDFIHLLDNSEPLTSFDIEDDHSFNPTIVATSPQRKKNRTVSNKKTKQHVSTVEEDDDDFDHVTEDDDEEQEEEVNVKSPPSQSSPGGGSSQKHKDMSSTRTSSPTNSQEKNSSPYPNGRKRASKACVECQKRHTRCGFERPCERCVRLGLECVEMKSTKKRGRSTMGGTNQDIDSPSVSTVQDKNGKSGKKTKSKASTESRKRKSSPEPKTNETKSKVTKIEAKSSTAAENVITPPTTPSIITTLTSSSTNSASYLNQQHPHIDASQVTQQHHVEKPLGVVAVGPDFTTVQYVSDPLSTMFEEQPLTRLESIMGSDFIQSQLNLLCEAKATRETIISHVDNGLAVLQQAHLRAERTARAMIKLKDGKLAEMSIKFVFMYNPANPSILDSAYVFLNWNGSYIVGNQF